MLTRKSGVHKCKRCFVPLKGEFIRLRFCEACIADEFTRLKAGVEGFPEIRRLFLKLRASCKGGHPDPCTKQQLQTTYKTQPTGASESI